MSKSEFEALQKELDVLSLPTGLGWGWPRGVGEKTPSHARPLAESILSVAEGLGVTTAATPYRPCR